MRACLVANISMQLSIVDGCLGEIHQAEMDPFLIFGPNDPPSVEKTLHRIGKRVNMESETSVQYGLVQLIAQSAVPDLVSTGYGAGQG